MRTVSSLAEHYSLRTLMWCVFLVAFVPRLVFGLLHFHQLDLVEVDNIALSVSQGRGFGNPFGIQMPTGPTAFYPPIYICLKAALFALGDSDASRMHATVALSSFFTGVLCASLVWMSERVGVGRSTGLLAGMISALLPLHAWLEIRGPSDVVVGALCGVVLMGVMVGHWRNATFGVNNGLRVGAFAGIALLTSSSSAAILAGLLVAGAVLVWRQGQWRRYSVYAAVVVATTLALQVPWALRNKMVLGYPILTRDTLGMHLWLSNNPVARAQLTQNALIYAQYPYASLDGLQEMRRVGEVRFFEDCGRKAVLWIRQNPSRFLRMTAVRVVLFWFPPMFRPWESIFRWLVTLGGFVGLIVAARSRQLIALAIAGVWVFYPLVYYVGVPQDRYAYPVYQLQMFLAAYAITSVAARKSIVQRTQTSAQGAKL